MTMATDEATMPKSAGVLVENSSGHFRTEVGSIFSLALKKGGSAITVSSGATLSISTAVLQDGASSDCSLVYGETRKGTMTLCPLSKERPIVTGLGLTCAGPKAFCLRAVGGQINIFGSVTSNHAEPANQERIAPAAQKSAQKLTETVVRVEESVEEEEEEEEEEKKPAEPSTGSKKRKLAKNEEGRPEPEEEKSTADDDAPEQLSKTQRKKLAKQKAKELEEAVAILNKHDAMQKKDVQDDSSKRKHVSSMTKERRIKGGVLVRDIVIGTGALVKAGRKLSILYEGSFPDGKVFDRNKSKTNPLVFRQGTAQVVRGLELGMEGMKVGGEREITIPPELGYGAKGSGAVIPPNATLIFSVQFVAMGG
jgi:FKBP-type peptidyl-prolyl cis-trans isomerase